MLITAARATIETIPHDRPTVPEDPTAADLEVWRDRIDAIDAAVVNLLNERAVCANNIGRIKKHVSMPVYVPGREAEVITNVVAHNAGPLSDQAVRRLFERIIDETRSLERHLYQEDFTFKRDDVADD